jgi:hypothetical protein
LSFSDAVPGVAAHWKLAAIDRYAGPDRPLAWIDDAHSESCSAWAEARPGPTLLIDTDPAIGITGAHVATLLEWAESVTGSASGEHREHGREPHRDSGPGGSGVS